MRIILIAWSFLALATLAAAAQTREGPGPWAQRLDAAAQAVVAELDAAPLAPEPADAAAIQAWGVRLAAWADKAQLKALQKRDEITAAPALQPPRGLAPEVAAAAGVYRDAQLTMLSALGALYGDYAEIGRAAAAGNVDRVDEFSLASIDGAILLTRNSRDAAAFAAALAPETSPQAGLARAWVETEEAVLIALQMQRAIAADQRPDARGTAKALDDRAARIRVSIETARGALEVMARRLEAGEGLTPDETRQRARLRQALATYPASFAREERIAQTLVDAAAGLRLVASAAEADIAAERLFGTIFLLIDQRKADQAARAKLLDGP